MTVYRQKARLMLEAEHARSPEEALAHVTSEAQKVIGTSRLVSCEITASAYTGNSWNVTATFEKEGK